jgi:adenylate kinase
VSASVYVSGLPGVGKTNAVVHLVEARPNEYIRLSFGEALREVIAPEGSLEAFRGSAMRSVDRVAIDKATKNLARRIRDERTRVALVDSHAVTPASEGLRATPDTAERVAAFGYSVVAHLSAVGAEDRILRASGREGRSAMTVAEIGTAETVQLSIVARYASLCDCPLYILSAVGEVEEVADRLSQAIETGLRWATPKT